MQSLVSLAEDWQERQSWGILRGLILCAGILYGRTFCARTLLSRDLFSEVLRAHLCSCVPDGRADLPALLHLSIRYSNILRSRCWIILHSLCRGILNGLYWPAMRLRILLRRPGLELLKQGF